MSEEAENGFERAPDQQNTFSTEVDNVDKSKDVYRRYYYRCEGSLPGPGVVHGQHVVGQGYQAPLCNITS